MPHRPAHRAGEHLVTKSTAHCLAESSLDTSATVCYATVQKFGTNLPSPFAKSVSYALLFSCKYVPFQRIPRLDKAGNATIVNRSNQDQKASVSNRLI